MKRLSPLGGNVSSSSVGSGQLAPQSRSLNRPTMTRIERSAGGVIFRRHPDGRVEVLVIRDSHDGWAFPKGRIEVGEAPVQAARRETGEEVGVTDLTLVKHLGKNTFWFTDRWERPGQKVR